MSVDYPEDLELARRQRDRALRSAEDRLEEAASRALRSLLARMRSAVTETLTASAPRPGSRRMTSDFYTLGDVHRWWDEALEADLMDDVRAVWEAGRAAVVDDAVSRGSLDSMGDYLAQVRDRLSRTAQPTIPEEAFQQVRLAVASEVSRGSSTDQLARRIAAELDWTGPDRGFWEGRRDEVASLIESKLDAYGPPGDPLRETIRRTDPEIRALQAQRSEAVKALDRDQSVWETRARRIARTETTGAYNAGSYQAYEEAGVAVRVWLATGDDRTREDHLDASGQCVPQGEPFVVGGTTLMYPGDPSGPADQIVNCRCTTIAARSCDEAGRIGETAQATIQEERDRREMPPQDDRPSVPEPPMPELETNPLDQEEGVFQVEGERTFPEPTHRSIENFTDEEIDAIERSVESAQAELQQALDAAPDEASQLNVYVDHDMKYGNARMNAIYEQQGFNALPEIVPDLDAVPGGAKVYRGISGVQGSSGFVDGATLAAQFTSGPTHWAGKGVFGSGTYSTTNQTAASMYARGLGGGTSPSAVGGTEGAMLSMKLKPGARVADWRVLGEVMDDDMRRLAASGPAGAKRADAIGKNPHRFSGGGLDDLGEWAAAQGYDAMTIAEGNDTYYVIFNRGAVYVQG